MSRRLSDLANQRKAAERRADELATGLEKALATIERLTAAQQQKPPEPASDAVAPRPARDRFDDPDAYDAALIEWSAGQAGRIAAAELDRKIAEQRAADEKVATEKAATEQNEALQRDWTEKRSKALEAHPDYEEVAERADLPITMPMVHAIVASDVGPEIAYYLGSHPEEAARIAALSNNPVRTVYEIGKIAAQVSNVTVAQPSKLPTPITPIVPNAAAAAQRTPDEMTTEEYAAMRMPQLRAERKAGMLGIPKGN
ncbi:MAG: hypothetical protein ACREDY_00875 [Bradyrhizobium sp.]